MTIQMTAIQSSIDSSRQEFAVESDPLAVLVSILFRHAHMALRAVLSDFISV